MPDVSPLVFALGTVVVLVFLLWFAVGTQRNIRKGNSLLRWLQGGLPLLGKRTSLRWLGSSAVELNISEPRKPFDEAQVVVVLEPRDVGFLWGWFRAKGRRDFIILRAGIPTSPRFELEAGDASGWTGADGLRRVTPEAWDEADWGDPGVRVAHSGVADPDAVRIVWQELRAATAGVWRLSIRRTSPQLEVHVLPPDESREAEPLFRAFRHLAEVAAKPA